MTVYNSNDQLVDALIQQNSLKSQPLKEAFFNIDRQDFVKKADWGVAYEDRPLSIGPEATISQPTTVAMMLEALQLKAGESVLDIGSGSGYATALIAKTVGPLGAVLGLEIQADLCGFSRNNLVQYNLEQVSILQAKEDVIGMPGKQFDKILVSAAAKQLPEGLLDQLKLEGVLVIPIKSEVWVLTKTSRGEIHKRILGHFRFVGLK